MMSKDDKDDCEAKRAKIYARLWIIVFFILAAFGSGFLALRDEITNGNDKTQSSLSNLSKTVHQTKGQVDTLLKWYGPNNLSYEKTGEELANKSKGSNHEHKN